MDISVAYLRKDAGLDLDTQIELAELEVRKVNKNPKVVLCRVFLGRLDGSEAIPINAAFEDIVKKYDDLGVEVYFEKITNVNIFAQNWSPKDLVDVMLEADLHVLPTLLHQNCLARGGSDIWHMDAVMDQLKRLRNHLGSPSGIHVHCPLLVQNMAELFSYLHPLGLCAPFEIVSILDREISGFDLARIQMFVQRISQDPKWSNSNRFVVKVNHTSGSHYGSYVKFAEDGVDGIITKLKEIMNNGKIFGYINTAIIQPRIPHNTQASVVCFDGEAKLRNPHKKGRDRTSPFGRSNDRVFFDFAENVIRQLRIVCPQLIARQILRVDFHGLRYNGALSFYVNVIEGYETRVWGAGRSVDKKLEDVASLNRSYWFDVLDTLIECHLELPR